MEVAAQPICLPICMNAYFFHGRFVLHLQTGNVNRSAISSGAFAVFPLEIHWIQSWNTPPCLWNSKLRYPPTSSEFQSKKPPLSRNSKMPPVVWYGYFLESPNGPHHHYTTVLLYLAQVDKAFSVKLMEYNQFEAGKGKTVLDTHFTRVSHKTVRWVSVGNDLDTREKLGNLLEVISTLYLSNGLTWLGTNTRDFGRIWKFMWIWSIQFTYGYFQLPQNSFNVYAKFLKAQSSDFLFICEIIAQVLCDLMSIVFSMLMHVLF